MFLVMDNWYKPLYECSYAYLCRTFTADQIRDLLCGECVAGHFLEFSDSYRRKITIDYLVNEHGDFDQPQVCDMLGVSRSFVMAAAAKFRSRLARRIAPSLLRKSFRRNFRVLAATEQDPGLDVSIDELALQLECCAAC